MNRRSFCTSLLALPPALGAAKELSCDIAVIGGGIGGCAAALAALRNGMRVILTEETDWIGGQLPSQAVPPDEPGGGVADSRREVVGASRPSAAGHPRTHSA